MSAGKELRRRLERALATMEPRTREVFLMHRLEELSYPAIAEWLGIGARDVEQEIARAILHLDRELRRMEAEEGE